jgi:hypothetical protein
MLLPMACESFLETVPGQSTKTPAQVSSERAPRPALPVAEPVLERAERVAIAAALQVGSRLESNPDAWAEARTYTWR